MYTVCVLKHEVSAIHGIAY